MSIGKNIARLRKEKGLTQRELGEMVGVSNQAVSKWESEITSPNILFLFGTKCNDGVLLSGFLCRYKP